MTLFYSNIRHVPRKQLNRVFTNSCRTRPSSDTCSRTQRRAIHKFTLNERTARKCQPGQIGSTPVVEVDRRKLGKGRPAVAMQSRSGWLNREQYLDRLLARRWFISVERNSTLVVMDDATAVGKIERQGVVLLAGRPGA